jgi:hypothetical protein
MAGPWPAQSVSWDRCLSNRFWLRQPLPVSDKQLLWQKIRSRLNFSKRQGGCIWRVSKASGKLLA